VGASLVCRICGTSHPAGERFCPRCGVPLVLDAEPIGRVSERHERARKVKGQYSEGPLVRVARARHQAEAELIAGLLLEEGVASVTRRSGGFDVPDFLAAGPRDVLVAQSGVDIARDVLRVAPQPQAPENGRSARPLWVQALAVTMVMVVVISLAATVLFAVLA
jgi:zinc-ribbon domain